MKIIKKSDLTEEEILKINSLFPKRYESAWLEDVSLKVIKTIEFVKENKESSKTGIFLFGKCGTGKTHILYALKKQLILEKYLIQKNKYPDELKEFQEKKEKNTKDYIHEPEKPTMRGGFKIWNSTELSSQFREDSVSDNNRNYTLNSILNNYKIIVIDDFCSEKYSEFLEECFYRIINKVWEDSAPLIITSNYSLKEISERIGDRIASRIAGICEIINLDGEDKRLNIK